MDETPNCKPADLVRIIRIIIPFFGVSIGIYMLILYTDFYWLKIIGGKMMALSLLCLLLSITILVSSIISIFVLDNHFRSISRYVYDLLTIVIFGFLLVMFYQTTMEKNYETEFWIDEYLIINNQTQIANDFHSNENSAIYVRNRIIAVHDVLSLFLFFWICLFIFSLIPIKWSYKQSMTVLEEEPVTHKVYLDNSIDRVKKRKKTVKRAKTKKNQHESPTVIVKKPPRAYSNDQIIIIENKEKKSILAEPDQKSNKSAARKSLGDSKHDTSKVSSSNSKTGTTSSKLTSTLDVSRLPDRLRPLEINPQPISPQYTNRFKPLDMSNVSSTSQTPDRSYTANARRPYIFETASFPSSTSSYYESSTPSLSEMSSDTTLSFDKYGGHFNSSSDLSS